jgi:hypothetical protein
MPLGHLSGSLGSSGNAGSTHQNMGLGNCATNRFGAMAR